MQRRILIIIRRPAKRDTVSLRRSSLNINNPDDACDTAKFLATLDIAMELIERALFWAVIAVYGLGGVAVVAGFAVRSHNALVLACVVVLLLADRLTTVGYGSTRPKEAERHIRGPGAKPPRGTCSAVGDVCRWRNDMKRLRSIVKC